MPKEAAGRTNGVQVIARVADVLRALEDAPDGLSLSEIATRAGLARSTAQRLVTALLKEGFVASVGPRGRVRLGPTLARLGAASRRDIRDAIDPALQWLAEEVGETIDLMILEGSHVRVIHQLQSQHFLRAVSRPGVEFPLHATASGKLLLATLSDDDVKSLVPVRLPSFTPQTITSRAALLKELEQIRETGIAHVRDEYTAGVSGIAGAVFDADGNAVSIAMPVPTARFADIEASLVEPLLESCRRATEILGGSNVETRLPH
jgi:DNA-binding IclR family transcriptional regulator